MKLTKRESLKNINAQRSTLQPNPWIMLFFFFVVVVDHSGLKLRSLESLSLGTYIITSTWLETLSLRAGVVMQVITKSVLGKIIHISK